MDLILTLPAGSLWRSALGPGGEWDQEAWWRAEVADTLHLLLWAAMGCPEDHQPEPVARPGDRERREAEEAEAERRRSRAARAARAAREGKRKAV